MPMQPWYKVVTLRKEVREGRSFSPDEFAIALEQVVAGTAPTDYSDPAQFFSRTCFRCQGRSDVRPRGGVKVYQSVVTAQRLCPR